MNASLRSEDRTRAAVIVAGWILKNAVQVAAVFPTGTTWVPVAIDDDARTVEVIVRPPAV